MAASTQHKNTLNDTPSLLQMSGHMPDMALTLVRIQGRMLDAVMQQNIQTLDFLKSRFESDRKLAGALAAAEDSQQAMGIWASFWKQAVQDYTIEPQRLSRLAAHATNEALQMARDEAAAVMDTTRSTAV